MATNRNAMIRYQALDRCLSNHQKKYFMDDLIKACCDAIHEHLGVEEGVHRRQVWKDLAFMESDAGWKADIEHIRDGKKMYFRYADPNFSINKQPLSQEEVTKLKETLFLFNRFKGLPQFEWIEELVSRLEDRFSLRGQDKSVIGFDQNLDYEGLRHISSIFNAIINRQPLRINYRKFDGETFSWLIHPYYLKQYNCRWFLFGWNPDIAAVTNMPLDRITAFSTADDIPYIDKSIDFEEFFDDIIGVTIPEGNIEKILLKFAPERFPYVVSKPIHMSMKVKDKERCIVEISVRPNKELEQLIFSFGHHVEVLEPQWYRQQICKHIDELYMRYHLQCAN